MTEKSTYTETYMNTEWSLKTFLLQTVKCLLYFYEYMQKMGKPQLFCHHNHMKSMIRAEYKTQQSRESFPIKDHSNVRA